MEKPIYKDRKGEKEEAERALLSQLFHLSASLCIKVLYKSQITYSALQFIKFLRLAKKKFFFFQTHNALPLCNSSPLSSCFQCLESSCHMLSPSQSKRSLLAMPTILPPNKRLVSKSCPKYNIWRQGHKKTLILINLLKIKIPTPRKPPIQKPTSPRTPQQFSRFPQAFSKPEFKFHSPNLEITHSLLELGRCDT